MAMWADNVKFVKDIIDSKYQKIDSAIAEVILENDVLKAVERIKRIPVKIFLEGQLILCKMYMSF